ncbi:MAG: division/cell wall cluster transcriptional repressor MraZ [Salinispira sp.]
MLTGEYRNSLDEKGRLLIPARLRSAISGNSLVVTRGVDRCLWLFPPEEWKSVVSGIIEAGNPFQEKVRIINRRIIAPAQEIELDKSGRFNIPATLAGWAGLQKECMVLGISRYLEIWDLGEYQRYFKETENEFREAAEELGGLVAFNQKG